MSSAAVASLPFPAPKPQSEVFESHKNIPGKVGPVLLVQGFAVPDQVFATRNLGFPRLHAESRLFNTLLLSIASIFLRLSARIPNQFYHLPEVYAKEQRTTFSTSWLFLTHIGRVLRASKGEKPEAIEYEGHRAVYEAEVEWSGKKKPALVFEIAGFKFALRGSEVDGKPVVEGQVRLLKLVS